MTYIQEALKKKGLKDSAITSYRELTGGCAFCVKGDWFLYDSSTGKITKRNVPKPKGKQE